MSYLTNIGALAEFLSYWNGKDVFDPPRSSGIPTCQAIVVYKLEKRTRTVVTKARFSVHAGEDGQIELSEARGFRAEKYHLGFDPYYQSYTCDKAARALIVRGESDKMGKYEVTIIPDQNSN